MQGRGSDARLVKPGLLAGSVDFERALLAHGVGSVEDPVLPRGQAPEDAGVHVFLAGKTQVGLQAGQRVGRHGGAFFDGDADFVFPIDVVRGQGHEAEGAQQETVYLQWLLGLAERAEAVLQHAFVAGPRSGMQRYKAQSTALSRFHAGLRGGKKPPFPELVSHYAQQRTAGSFVSEGEVRA